MFLFLLFLHFHSCSSFFPVPLFYLLYCLFYLFSLGDNTKWPTRIDVSLNPNTINHFLVVKFSVYLNRILFIMFAQSNQGLYCSKLSQCILQAVLMHRLNWSFANRRVWWWRCQFMCCVLCSTHTSKSRTFGIVIVYRSQAIYTVKLSPDVIRGANFCWKDIYDHSTMELMHWLTCHDLTMFFHGFGNAIHVTSTLSSCLL